MSMKEWEEKGVRPLGTSCANLPPEKNHPCYDNSQHPLNHLGLYGEGESSSHCKSYFLKDCTSYQGQGMQVDQAASQDVDMKEADREDQTKATIIKVSTYTSESISQTFFS